MRLDNRFPPPLLMLLTAGLMWLCEAWPPMLPGGAGRTVLAVALATAGLIVTGLGVTRFRAADTTIDPTHPERAAHLVVGGIYRLTRNPMYLGFATMLSAWALQLGSVWTLAGPLLFVLYIDRFQIRPEERALQARFGEAFAAYTGRVRRWV
jgi:protein-S-isoprenylcysteine O-methyltransferase Ste14